jgi:hypothetical protein
VSERRDEMEEQETAGQATVGATALQSLAVEKWSEEQIRAEIDKHEDLSRVHSQRAYGWAVVLEGIRKIRQ